MLTVAAFMYGQGHWGVAILNLLVAGIWVAIWIIWYKVKKEREETHGRAQKARLGSDARQDDGR